MNVNTLLFNQARALCLCHGLNNSSCSLLQNPPFILSSVALADVHRAAAKQSLYHYTSWVMHYDHTLAVGGSKTKISCWAECRVVPRRLHLNWVKLEKCVYEEVGRVHFLRQFHIAANTACNHSNVKAQYPQKLQSMFKRWCLCPSGCDKNWHRMWL